jgi:hypothetical protein
MNEALLKQAGLVEEEVIAVDATGFRPTNASAYSQTRRGKPFSERGICCRSQQSNDCAWRWAKQRRASSINAAQVAPMSTVSQPG